jgi:hypothetical protein
MRVRSGAKKARSDPRLSFASRQSVVIAYFNDRV